MPLFPRKSTAKEEPKNGTLNNNNNNNNHKPCQGDLANEDEDDRQKLVFYCQQAQGSPTGIITGFNNVKELYQRISECYDFDPSEILFCTLNTHKVNMNKLLGAQIALNDFIFVHRKGRPKEVELTKKEEALGLTITDNGNGLAFIKRIKPGSVIDEIPVIQFYPPSIQGRTKKEHFNSYFKSLDGLGCSPQVQTLALTLRKMGTHLARPNPMVFKVGDHIEKINNESLVGKRHFEVAKYLKDIPLGSTFTLRLISPLQAGFYNIGPREDRGKGKKASYGSGKETLRFKAGGAAVLEVVDDTLLFDKAVDGINGLLENYLGINDSELASRIWELSEGKKNSLDFLEALNDSDLSELGFSDDFVFELWGVITDARDGRL